MGIAMFYLAFIVGFFLIAGILAEIFNLFIW